MVCAEKALKEKIHYRYFVSVTYSAVQHPSLKKKYLYYNVKSLVNKLTVSVLL